MIKARINNDAIGFTNIIDTMITNIINKIKFAVKSINPTFITYILQYIANKDKTISKKKIKP